MRAGALGGKSVGRRDSAGEMIGDKPRSAGKGGEGVRHGLFFVQTERKVRDEG